MAGSINRSTITQADVVDQGYDNLTENLTVKADEDPARWEIVKLDGDGKAVKLTADTDTPYGIMAATIDSDADVQAEVFVMGVFSAAGLIASDDSVDVADMKTNLRSIGIFLI